MKQQTDASDVILERHRDSQDAVFYQIRVWKERLQKYILSEPLENFHYARWRIANDLDIDPDTVPIVDVEPRIGYESKSVA